MRDAEELDAVVDDAAEDASVAAAGSNTRNPGLAI